MTKMTRYCNIKKIDFEVECFLPSKQALENQRRCASVAVRRLLIKKNIELASKNFNTKNNLFLDDYPNLLISKSHTVTASIAVIADKQDAKSIGVDIEKADRIIAPRTKKFFINPKDNIKGNSLLELWTIKEACFKAVSPIYDEEKVLVLTDIIITDDKYFKVSIFGKTIFRGSFETSLIQSPDDNNYIISIAIV